MIKRAAIVASIVLLVLIGLPARAQDAGEVVVYEQDFDGGAAPGWDLESGWRVQDDVLRGEGHQWANANQNFSNQSRLTFRLRLERGDVHLVFRLNETGRYYIGFNQDSSSLHKQYWPNTFLEDLTRVETFYSLNEWHDIDIINDGARINFRVDDVLHWTYADPEPLSGGSLAFETLDNSVAYIDDVVVYAPGAAPPPETGSGSSSSGWQWLGGPPGGLGYDIRMRPDNPDIMIVTDANAGAFRSDDGGQQWYPINDGIDKRGGPSGDIVPVFCATIDPNDPDIVWVGLQDQSGIYRSEDGGQTWELRTNGIQEPWGFTLRGFGVEPGDSNVVYAAGEISSWYWAGEGRMGALFDKTMGVVYKSTDGGQNWREVWRGDNLARYVLIDPRDTDVVYVSTGIFDREARNTDVQSLEPGGVGVLKSTDGGDTWQILDAEEGLTGLYVGSLQMHPDDPDTLIAGAGHDYWSAAYDRGGTEFSETGVFITTDGGQSWTQTLDDCTTITSIEMCEGDTNIVYAGSERDFYRSEDGGYTWRQMDSPTEAWGPDGVVAGFPIDMQCDPRDSDRLFVNNYGGGNFLSTDGARTWDDASQGYTGANLRNIHVDPANPDLVYASGRSGLWRSDDGGTTWYGLQHPPARATEVTAMAANPQDFEHVIESPWDIGGAISFDGGQTWQRRPVGQQHGLQTVVIAFAPSDPQTVYATRGAEPCRASTNGCEAPGAGVYVSHDGGLSWRAANDANLQQAQVIALAIDPSDAQVVYAGAFGDGLYKTVDGGASWRRTSLHAAEIFSVAVAPNDPALVIAGTDEGVWRSHDGGQTWQWASAGLDAEVIVTSIVIDPANTIWIGTRHSGVYRSTNGGERWELVNEGLLNRFVIDLSITADGRTLYAASEGGGAFRLDVGD